MSCDDLQIYVDELLNSEEDIFQKKGNLLQKWIGRYVTLLRNENRDVTQYKYERGAVIKVNLGYRIGSELGGVHYCVVVNCADNSMNKTLVVIPMSSYKGVKDGKDIRASQMYIGTELKDLLSTKLTGQRGKVQKELDEAKECDPPAPTSIISQLTTRLISLVNEELELSYMKDKSIILMNQIMTISKHRVIVPRNSYDVLSNVKLSPATLDRLNAKINESIVGKP